MGKQDVGSKHLINYDPDAWVRWLLNDQSAKVIRQLDGEFQFVMRRSDSLLEVESDIDGRYLALLEFQLNWDEEMDARLQNYSALGREKYGLPVVPCVIYLTELPSGVKIVSCYHREFKGLVTHQDFKVFCLWDYSATIAYSPDTPLAILPFIPLMQGINETILRVCVARIREEAGNSADELETVLNLFARMSMSPALVEKILRLSMAVLEKTPIYQEIFLRGKVFGEANAADKSTRNHIVRQLKRRFGFVPERVAFQLDQVTGQELALLLDAVTDSADLPAFVQFFETIVSNSEL